MKERPQLSLPELERYDADAVGKGKNKRFLCPFCGDEKPGDTDHRSMSVDTEQRLYHCWRCGVGGKFSDWKKDLPPLSRKAKGPPPRGDAEAPRRASVALGAGLEDWRKVILSMVPIPGTPGEAYLLGRGIDASAALRCGIRFLRAWYGRPAVMFPLRDDRGRLVGVQGRYVDGHQPKTRTSGTAGEGVYATPGAWDHDPLILVEGPFDALSFWDVGFPAVAMMGCKMPPWVPLVCAGRRVMVATDHDPLVRKNRPGNVAARAWNVALSGVNCDVLRLCAPVEGDDWNDMLLADRAGFQAHLKAALAPINVSAALPRLPRLRRLDAARSVG